MTSIAFAPAEPAGQTQVTKGAPTTFTRLFRWRNTPERIRGLAVVTIILAIALGTVMAVIFSGIASGVRAIGSQAAPEVQATTDLYFRLNDMDAQVANILLVGNRTNLGESRSQAEQTYETDRRFADTDLQQAAAVAGSNPAARAALREVLDNLGQYEALVGQIDYLEAAGPSSPGRPPTAALATYRTATDLLKTSMLPAANHLTSANAAALEATYEARHSQAIKGVILVLLLGLALVALLVATQFYLSATHRRTLNPALAAATLVALVLTVAGADSLAAQASHLHVAKQDAFDSILALTQARAVSYDANADESRYLVDPARAGQYQNSFEAESQQLARLDVPGIFSYDAGLAKAISAYKTSQAVDFGGFLGAEFRNITFPGERAAAEKTLYAYQIYERDDRHLRALNRHGDLSAAIAFDTSSAPGNSNYAFYRYDQALVSVITINQRAFTKAITASEHSTSGWTFPIPAIATLLILILALAGLRARLAEYR